MKFFGRFLYRLFFGTKARIVCLILFLALLSLSFRVYQRFHFSKQFVWPLAELQWDDGSEFTPTAQEVSIIGHRGSAIPCTNGGWIGNTRRGIAGAAARGVELIEIDIRATSDRQLVVFHDKSIRNKSDRRGQVSDLSLADLQEATLAVDPPEKILCLDDLLEQFRDFECRWVFDIKDQDIDDEFKRWIDAEIHSGRLTKEQVVIIGTDKVIKDYRATEFPRGLIVPWSNLENQNDILFRQSKVIQRCEKNECDYLVLPVIFAVDELIDLAISHNLQVWVYGIEHQRDFQCLSSRGVSGFIVDQPGLFMNDRER